MQKIHLAILTISLLFMACGSSEDQQNNSEVIDETVIEEIEMDDDVSYMLPSPLQVAELFKRSGLSYIGDLTSAKNNVDKFNSKYDQKINFGVYSADMAYCIMNKQTQESIDYLNVLRELSEKLFLTDVLNTMNLRERLEANMNDEDSLIYIMTDLQIQLDDYLYENEIGDIGIAIFAGAWIETMYLGAQVNESVKNDKLIYRLSEQALILGDLIKAIRKNNENKKYNELISDLENINTFFAPLMQEEDTDDILVLNDGQVKELSAAIIGLRTKIIGQ